MKKIPTVFERDWDGDRSRVTEQVHPGCEWVIFGEGIARQKYDGTCVLIRDAKLYKRHEVREGKQTPDGFEEIDHDDETGKRVGWVPVGDGPEDRWHREAFDALLPTRREDGTYELVGPKIQGNPEGASHHQLVRHAEACPYIVPRTFEGMRDLLSDLDVEGFVFHHEDGRMAKIKARDFGIKRKAVARV